MENLFDEKSQHCDVLLTEDLLTEGVHPVLIYAVVAIYVVANACSGGEIA